MDPVELLTKEEVARFYDLVEGAAALVRQAAGALPVTASMAVDFRFESEAESA